MDKLNEYKINVPVLLYGKTKEKALADLKWDARFAGIRDTTLSLNELLENIDTANVVATGRKKTLKEIVNELNG